LCHRYSVVAAQLMTGLRQGEILALQWPAVDLFRRTITVLEQKNRDIDTLPFNEEVFEVLRAEAKI
jgi:integrase